MSVQKSRAKEFLDLSAAAKKAAAAMASISPMHIPSKSDWEALRDAQRELMKAIDGTKEAIEGAKRIVEREEKLNKVGA